MHSLSEYISTLEEELQTLKSKCRHLEQEIQDLGGRSDDRKKSNEKADADVSNRLAKDNIHVAMHVEQLNNMIGTLRAEKVELTAQMRKQQSRIVHLESAVDQLSKQVGS